MKRKRDHKRTGNFLESAMVIDLTQDSSSDELRGDVTAKYSVKMPRLPSSNTNSSSSQAGSEADSLLQDFNPRHHKRTSPPNHQTKANRNQNYLEKSHDNESSSQSSRNRTAAISVVVPPSSRAASISHIIAKRRESSSTFSTHDDPSYYPVDGDAKRSAAAAYPKSKTDTQKVNPDRGKPYPHTVRDVYGRPFLTRRILIDMYMQKLSGLKGPPVTLNLKNQKLSIDSNFEFLNECKIHDDVEQFDKAFHYGCSCENACDSKSCDCLVQEEESDKMIVPYMRRPDGLLVLRSDFMRRKKVSIISECSILCECPPSCFNRVVQYGRTIRLEIFHTGPRGFGLKSPDRIRAGQFIDCYFGEIITQQESERRENSAGANEASYLFSLDHFSKDDINVIDGRKFGGVTRFMNHSCEPNCKIFSATQRQVDDRIYDLAFFALEDISPGTELTFDYNPHWKENDPHWKKNIRKGADPDVVKCLCGSKNCRGQLWPNTRKTTN